jgi:DNA-binding protein Fis
MERGCPSGLAMDESRTTDGDARMSNVNIQEACTSSESYLRDLGESEPNGMYTMLVNVVEKPLEVVALK